MIPRPPGRCRPDSEAARGLRQADRVVVARRFAYFEPDAKQTPAPSSYVPEAPSCLIRLSGPQLLGPLLLRPCRPRQQGVDSFAGKLRKEEFTFIGNN
ncbi:hypothetical protein MRX96_033338 [Rhipicephalus microplus]